MIRYTYINNIVLRIYKKLPKIQFPLDINSVIVLLPNCRYMSYQKFAEINKCSITDVVQLCESKSGCTHYDIFQNRYLILCNHSSHDNNTPGRQRWTGFHEFGHIICKHHSISTYNKLSEHNLLEPSDSEYEMEADYFAATILAPFPLFKLLNINSASDIQQIFGLSQEASTYRYSQYVKWKQTRRKTSWENDMIREYKQKNTA